MRVVTDPYEARRVVADGKMAVVMGMETSALFGCRGNDQTPECDRAKIDRGLAEFRKLGVRSFFPVHKFDNPIGGTKMDGGTTGLVVNPGNKLAFGSFWDARTCKGPETDNTQTTSGGARRRPGARRCRHAAAGRAGRPDPGLPARAALQRARPDAAGPPPDRQARWTPSRSWRSTTWARVRATRRWTSWRSASTRA